MRPLFRSLLPGILYLFTFTILVYVPVAYGHEFHSHHTYHSAKTVSRSKHTAQGRLYSIPFVVETYVPVYPNTITRNADKIAFLDAEDLTFFYRILSEEGGLDTMDAAAFYHTLRGRKKTQSFNPTHTRLRLDDGKEPPLLIDNEGVVLCHHTEYSLTPLAFVELDHFITSLRSNK